MHPTFLAQDLIHSKFARGISNGVILLAVLIGSFLSPFSATPALAVAIPSPISPTDNTYISATGYQEPGYSAYQTASPLAIPQFQWSAVEGTKNYRIQFSQNIGFSPVAVEVTTPNTIYTPNSSDKFPDGNLYWRVRADSPTVGNFSSPTLFVKDWASPDNRPNLIAPLDGAKVDFYKDAIFSWQPVPGASQYRIQFASSPDGFSSTLSGQDKETPATSYQPTQKMANGVYYWRVVPMDPNKRLGTPSQVYAFEMSYGRQSDFPLEIPTLLGPADHSFPTFTPTFRWEAVRGAQFYRLQYTTDPTCNFGQTGFTTTVDTRNTTYTPTQAFPNDVNYCWHVRAHSDLSISDWSPVLEFQKRWYIQPVLLTPTNLFQQTSTPFMSWTPVPGASQYKIEANTINSFPVGGGGVCQFTVYTANTHYVHMKSPGCIPGEGMTVFWRVTPIDRDRNEGKPSNVFSFTGGFEAPALISPLYYYTYPPGSYPAGSDLNPKEDRSIAYPVFQWHRMPDNSFINQQPAYEVQVNANNPFLDEPDWKFQTENLSAVPTSTNPFTPIAGTDYYWRVCPLTAVGGEPDRECSQAWRTRFDLSKTLARSANITLLRPAPGSEFVETTPLLEWWPQQGADSYDIQVSVDSSFGDSYIVDSATVPYPIYTPQHHLDYYPGQDPNLEFGTYYWRVKGRNGASSVGDWSPGWRFQVAAQSNWRVSRTLGNLPADNRLIAEDPAGDTTDAAYDLTNLYSAESGGPNNVYWYFGFNVSSTDSNTGYVLYIDQDHKELSGANHDAEGYSVTAISPHLPEYAIYIYPTSGSFSSSSVKIYAWNNGDWDFPVTLSNIGGTLSYAAPYLELKIPSAAIHMEEETSSASLALFSVDKAVKLAKDTVPSGSTGTLDRFTSITGLTTLAMPPSNATGDPSTFPSIPPFTWQFPIDVPYYGYNIQIGVDPELTTWLYDIKVYGSDHINTNYSANSDTNYEFQADNTYYWRVRPLYNAPGAPNNYIAGAWSDPGRFERSGFLPTNLTESVTFATPTFSWDLAEGADGYDIQVDMDPNFGTPEFGTVTTAQNSYTPVNALSNGTYYWRVRARRFQNLTNDWAPAKTFTLSLPRPDGLTPNNPDPNQGVHTTPTFCWNPIDRTSGGISLLTAWKYKIQVSKDSAFGSIYDSPDPTEQTCWTPTKGYEDGTYYWRVAMMDGNGHFGDFSPAAQFTKQYSAPELVSPLNGSQVNGAPTFTWKPVDGAASYKLEVSLNETFSPTFDSVTTNNTSYIPTKSYPTTTTYYWRVAMLDKDNKTGPFSNATLLSSGNGGDNGGGGTNGGPTNLFLPALNKP